MDKLLQAAENVLKSCMGVKQGESVLVVVDTPQLELGRAFFAMARELKTEAQLVEFLPRDNHGVEPPQAVAMAMQAADVVLMPTSKSLSHTQARKDANAKGARVASLPGITRDMMERTLLGNYGEIAERSRKVQELLNKGKRVELTSEGGTEIEMSIEGRTGIADTGQLTEPGAFGNLPAGEAYIAPVEGTAQGTVVIDGAMSGVGTVSQPITIKIKNGVAVQFSGGEEAEKLESLVDKHGEKARHVAELGIGTNDLAKLTGLVLEDEKVLGTVHLALGDNHTFGGNIVVPSHLDGMILKPTLKIDGQVILEKGILVID